jgi:long-chain fatty acid transport protein
MKRYVAMLAITLIAGPGCAFGNAILDNGFGAQSQAMGGADVAYAASPLGAMGANPAALGFYSKAWLEVGGVGGFVNGHFEKPGVSSGNLDGQPHALPEGAFAIPFLKQLPVPVTVGLSFVPESNVLANWNYNDPPGGLGGVSYGEREDKSEILLLRSALGAAVQITPQLSVGASVGLLYNKNELDAPYIFQHLGSGPGGAGNSGLDGAKTLLNLQTEGLAWNAQVGALYKITPDLQVGISYESQSTVVSTGDAYGDPSRQFGAPDGTLPFHYDATVTNTFPQVVRAGVSWKFQPQWRVAGQLDWIDWSDAFNHLPLAFRNGSNTGVNAALGSSFTESTPLSWQSEFVYRLGFEYDVLPELALRIGYAYGNNPVPENTTTPLTAAVFQHTITAGVGYHWKNYHVDFAYQYDVPATVNIGTSELRSGEYSGSSIEVSAHEFTLSTGIEF